MAKSFYIKRQGGLHFWRIGRLGGSIYLAKRQPAPQAWRIAPRAHGPELRRVRSIDTVGGALLGVLYAISMASGMGIAALAMWH